MTWYPTVEYVMAKDVPGIYIAEYGGKEHERLDLHSDGTYLLDYFNVQGRPAYHQGGEWEYSFSYGRSRILFTMLPPSTPRTAWPKPKNNTIFNQTDTLKKNPESAVFVGTDIYKYHDSVVISIDPDVIFGYERKVRVIIDGVSRVSNNRWGQSKLICNTMNLQMNFEIQDGAAGEFRGRNT
jgi:hypothetical protein